MKKITIGMIDTNNLFRMSLQSYLSSLPEMAIQYSAGNLDTLEQSSSLATLRVLLVDIENMNPTSYRTIKKVMLVNPELKTIILTDHFNRRLVHKLIECGIHGYCSKEIGPEELVQLIKLTQEDDQFTTIHFSSDIREKLLNDSPDSEDSIVPSEEKTIFNEKEIRIMQLICAQKSNHEIAEELNMCSRTVETYRSQLIKKTNSRNIVGVAVYAMQHNIATDFVSDIA